MTTQLEEGPGFTLPAAADLSASQYLGCTINTSGQVALITNGTTYLDGILQNSPTSGGQARLQDKKILKVVAGGAVTVGALASMNTVAKGVISVTSGDFRFGKFLDAGAAGDIVRVLIQRGLPNVP